MENSNIELSEFIKSVNKGIVNSMFMKEKNPLLQNVDILCIMDRLNVKFDVRVDKHGHVTQGHDVAANLIFHFQHSIERVKNHQCQEDPTTVHSQV